MRRIFILIIFIVLTFPLFGKKTVIKLATLAPDGSEWYYMLVDLGQQWENATDGRVKLRIYPGGVIGDERDMIRKMRIGQIHGAAITAEGLSELNPDFYMFFVPLLLESYDEVDFIRSKLKDELYSGIRSNGFELMMINDVGWVYWFTTQPIKHPDDLKNHKIFSWAGDYKFSEIWEKAGYQSVPLSSIDILPGLQTGLIDAISSNPQFALAQQMLGICNHMLDLKWGLLTGGVVLDSRIFANIDSKDKEEMLKISEEFEKQYQATLRHRDQEAIEVMKNYNLVVNQLKDEEKNNWYTIVDDWYPSIRDIFTNPEFFDKVVDLKKSYKKKIEQLDESD
jgi:TRAP-type C4-dicarboxylate transport system substrate-binding protein